MVRSLLFLAGAAALAACAMQTPVPASLRSEMAPTGMLRVGVNFGNPAIAQKDPAGRAPRGVGPELGRQPARRLGGGIEYLALDRPGQIADAGKQGGWCVAFLHGGSGRADQIDVLSPY